MPLPTKVKNPKQPTKKIDAIQNKSINALSKRVKKLEKTVVNTNYLHSNDTFDVYSTRSRSLIRLKDGTSDGMTSTLLFATLNPTTDYVYVRYLLIDAVITVYNNTLGNEHNPTSINVFVLKPRRSFDPENKATLTTTNGLAGNDPGQYISTLTGGQSYVNPKAFKVVKQKDFIVGGTGNADGYGVAHHRVKFKIPINKQMLIQDVQTSNDGTMKYPSSFQDQMFFAISASGGISDLQAPQCILSTLLCYQTTES